MSSVITFDSNPGSVTDRVIRITGTLQAAVTSLEFGNAFSSMVAAAVSGNRFSCVVELTPGRNELFFQPYNITSTPLQSERYVITYTPTPVQYHQVQTSLDLHAQSLGYERLPGERAVSLKKRILQGGRARALRRNAVPMQLATEMGFPFSEEMIRFHIGRTTYNHPALINCYIQCTPFELKVTADSLVTSEGPIVFDAGHPYYTTLEELSPFGRLQLVDDGGTPVGVGDYEYDAETNRIHLLNTEMVGKDLMLVYNSVQSFTLASYTLATLKVALEAALAVEMEITESEFHTDANAAGWMIPFEWARISEQETLDDETRTKPGVYASVSEIRVYPLHVYRREFLVDGSGLGTKLEKYVREVNDVDHRTWAQIIVGQDGLRDRTITPLYDPLPHLMDGNRGYWGTDYNIHEVQYLGTGLHDVQNPFNGLAVASWQSGTGALGDLENDGVVEVLTSHTEVVDVEETFTNVLYGII